MGIARVAKLLAGAVREVGRIPSEARRHRPHPPTDGLVVDVGGGDAPHPRADVLVDKYVVDNFERAGDVATTKPLVVADGERLPFADKTFAYAIAAHVLEHAIDPQGFASELSRTARAGFVQVPSRRAELTFGWAFHPWLVDQQDGVLVFEPRDNRRAPCGQAFHDDYEHSRLFQAWFAAHRSDWHHSIHWDGDLTVKALGVSTAEATAELDVERTVEILRQLVAERGWPPLPPAVEAALRCPRCRSQLRLSSDSAGCAGCMAAYPQVGPVAVLVEEAAA